MTERNVSIRLAAIGGGQVRRELDQVGTSGRRAMERVERATQPASRGLVAVDRASRDVQRQFEGLARRAGPVGAGLTALGPAGLAAAAAIGGMVLALRHLIQVGDEAERRTLRLEAQLTATGHSAGRTAAQIQSFARDLARETLASARNVEDAAARLATFGAVSGAQFERAIRLSQDMAAAFGTDLRSNVEILGRALSDLERNLTLLERRFGSFGDELRETVAELVAVGRESEAAGVIMEALEGRIGGTGGAEARGLAGAIDNAKEAWRDFREEMAAASSGGSAAAAVFNALAEALRAISPGPVRAQIEALDAQIADLDRRIERFRGIPLADLFMAPSEAALKRLRETRAALAEIVAGQEQDAVAAAAGERMQLAGETAQAIRRIEESLQQDLERFSLDRLAKIEAEERRTFERLRGMRATVQGRLMVGEIDPDEAERQFARIAEAMDLAERRFAAEREEIAERAAEQTARAEEAERRRADSARQRAEAVAAANASVVAGMERELELLTTLDGAERERAAFIDQAVSRLRDASEERIEQVRRLAGELFDERQEQEQLVALRREAEQLADSLATAEERFAAAKERLNEALRRGAIDLDTYIRASDALHRAT